MNPPTSSRSRIKYFFSSPETLVTAILTPKKKNKCRATGHGNCLQVPHGFYIEVSGLGFSIERA